MRKPKVIMRIGGKPASGGVVHDDDMDEYLVPDGNGGKITAQKAYPEAFKKAYPDGWV